MIQPKWSALLIFLIAAVLIILDINKAANASFTWDESYTYLKYIDQSVADIFTYAKSDANNHILNTFLMKVSRRLFGISELTLRLPAIFAHVLFILFSAILFIRFTPKLAVPFFILLNANPFLLDFFSLARGYGLSVGMMMGGIYFYCNFLNNNKAIYHLLSLLFFTLACLASFALTNVFFSVLFLHNVLTFVYGEKKLSLKNLLAANIINAIGLSVFIVVLFLPLKKLFSEHLIVVGGWTGFWTDTALSLLHSSFFYASYETTLTPIIKFFIALVFIIAILQLLFYTVKRKKAGLIQKQLLFVSGILVLIVLENILQYRLLKNPFLMNRYALFILPVFMLTFLYIIYHLFENSGKGILAFTFLLTFAFGLHTILSYNNSWYCEWKNMTAIDAEKNLISINNDQSIKKDKIEFGCTWIYEPIFNFYRTINNLDRIAPVSTTGISYTNDYMMVSAEDMKRIPANEKTQLNYYEAPDNYFVKHHSNKLFSEKINIKAANDMFLIVLPIRNDDLLVNSPAGNLWETFALKKLNDGAYHITSFNYHLLALNSKDTVYLDANGSDRSNGLSLSIIANSDSSKFYFQTRDKKYVTLDRSAEKLILKNDTTAESRFELIRKL